MGTARVRTMTVEQVHAWARGIPGLPRGDADGFAGQCFLEDIDGTALLAQTRDTLCNELGVAQHHVGAVEAAIASLLSHEGAVGANVTAATPRSVHDTFHELMVSEGVPPYSPGAAARVSAAHPPASTPSFLLQVERSLSALQDRYGSVVALEKSLSHEAFESAQKQRAVSVAAAEAVRLDLEEQLTGHSEVCRALEHRAAAAEREVWEARHLSDALMTTVESRHITREAELVARVEELMARIAEQTQARVTAERRRDEMESELELAQAIGEAAQEELATELGRSREEKAATKIQMIWRLHRVTKAALTDPLSRRALLLEVESARVAAAAKNMQIKVCGCAPHEFGTLAFPAFDLASDLTLGPRRGMIACLDTRTTQAACVAREAACVGSPDARGNAAIRATALGIENQSALTLGVQCCCIR